ncbi:trimeric intracellular cation channel family protein [Candidatus Thioglobus sp.]|nr:trimeric intracellular cation channel family protein [Candidatus Thioglobus sp.]
MINLEITQEFSSSLYWVSLVAVVVSSASGVLKSGFRQFDLFGVVIIAITTGLGGGSLRDMLLDIDVFWIKDQIFFIVSLTSAVVIFIGARSLSISSKFFLIPDAAGLAAFSIAGTMVALMAGAPWLIASFMGVITGAMGGIFRDLLCNETPIVFKSPLYATAAWIGSLGFIVLVDSGVSVTISAIVAGLSIFITRLLALRFNLGLPKFQLKEK